MEIAKILVLVSGFIALAWFLSLSAVNSRLDYRRTVQEENLTEFQRTLLA